MLGLEAEELWIDNPLLYTDVEKYIWISNSPEKHKEAQNLFYYFLRRKVYINGFVTDSSSMVGLKMYHKYIYGTEVLQKDNAVFFCDLDADVSNVVFLDKLQYIKSVTIERDEDNVIVWGSGDAGEQVFHILARKGIKVRYFVDSDERKDGMMKCGVPVYSPKKLDSESGYFVIVEAMDRWKELDDMIRDRYERRLYYPYFRYQKLKKEYNPYISCEIAGRKEAVFSLTDETFYYLNDKKIYIYGISAVEREAAEYLKLMDFEFQGFLIDETCEDIGRGCNPVKYVEEVLYDTDFMIWVYDRIKVEKLAELGLTYFKDYIYSMHATDITIKRKNVLDVNLGHNYQSQGKYPGFVVYGSDNEKDYKIVILGGSTTDSLVYPVKSWPQLLYEKSVEGNLTIYNGGVYGYNSGQEVLKLIRDVLVLKPDMILVYDGFNDMYCSDKYPYEFNYLGMIFKYASAHMEMNENYIDENKDIVCRGIASHNERFDNWLANIRTMYAIASERNIRFFCFCQPMLCSKKGKTMQEKNMLLSSPGEQIDFQVNRSFRKCMENMTQKPSYIYDLSGIFDYEPDVYMDICHVWEKGNRIIAQEIGKVIGPVLKESGVL